ncbi:MAG: hypothetical protein MUE95_08645 [Cyclobacteriaceae bacterium]|jgi:hypothetical protein|nr:hypothetical protein [Cyclobacteriaceae bacterium]
MRYNSFNQIHKGLRAMLYEAALALQHADLSDAAEGEEALQRLEEVLYLFDSHAHHEDQFFNEPLEQINPEVATLFEQEHKEDHRLATVLYDLISQWREEKTAAGRGITGRNLFYAFNEFIAFNLCHMNKEELVLNEALWKVYSDEEIKATEQALVRQTPPDKMMRYAKWMIRGCNRVELANWLTEVKLGAPPELLMVLLKLAEEQLTPHRFAAVKESVNAAAVPAD